MRRFPEAEQGGFYPLCIIAPMLAKLMGYFLLGLIRLLTPGIRAFHVRRV